MFFTIAIRQLGPGSWVASAPDLTACALEDADAASACARLRLLIEGRLADLLLTGNAIAQPRPLAAWRNAPALRASTLYEMHINLPHIEAVARHQQRHLRATAASACGSEKPQTSHSE